MKKWPFSVSTVVAGAIIALLSLVTLVLGSILLSSEAARSQEAFETKVSALTDQLASSLETPSWYLDADQVKTILASFFKDKDIVLLQVDGFPNQSFVLKRESSLKTIRKTRTIRYQDTEVGNLTVEASDSEWKEESARYAFFWVLTLIVSNVAVALSFYALFWFAILHPLKQLANSSRRLTQGLQNKFEVPRGLLFRETSEVTEAVLTLVEQLQDKVQQLGLSERRFRDLFAYTPTPLCFEDLSAVAEEIRSKDSTKLAIFKNIDRYAEKAMILGTNQSFLELFGLSVRRLKSGAFQGEFAKEIFKLELQAILEGRTSFQSECQVVSSDGKEKIVLVRWAALDSKQPYSQVFMALTDLTQRIQQERFLIDSNRKFETAFMLSPLAMSLTRFSDGKYVDVNDSFCALSGFTRKELIGTTSLDLNIWADPQERERFVKAVSNNESPPDLYYHLRRKDGQIVIVVLSARMVTFDQDRYILSVIEDQTERLAAEETDKLAGVGILASGLAHEINNPNQYIRTNLEFLQKAFEQALPILDQYRKEQGEFLLAGVEYSEVRDRLPEMFKDVLDGSKRIHTIISELKSYVRPEITEALEQVDVNDALQSAIELSKGTLKKMTINLSVSFGEALPPILARKSKIEQVMINLIQNACQALTQPSQGVFIRTETKADRVVIEVKDEGRGMSAEEIARLATPFHTTKRGQGGTGLGLYMSRNIVSAFGGTMTFTSIPDEGTTATVQFPAHVGETV